MGDAAVVVVGDLSPADKAFLDEQAAAIRQLGRRVVADTVEMGQRLLEVKARLPHGAFGRWLGAEFGMGERTAQNYMQVAQVFGDEAAKFSVSPSTLYALAAPSTPEPVRQEFLGKLRSGEVVRLGDVRAALGGDAPPPSEETLVERWTQLPRFPEQWTQGHAYRDVAWFAQSLPWDEVEPEVAAASYQGDEMLADTRTDIDIMIDWLSRFRDELDATVEAPAAEPEG